MDNAELLQNESQHAPQQALQRVKTIEELGLGMRITAPLVRLCQHANIPPTVPSLCSLTASQIIGSDRIGALALLKIRRALFEHGFRLAGDEAWDPSEPVDERGRPKKREKKKRSGGAKRTKKPAWMPEPRIRGSMFNLGTTCPGSVFLEQKSQALKTETGNAYTSIGQMGHQFLELAISQGKEAADAYLTESKADDELRLACEEFWAYLVESQILALSFEEAEQKGVQLMLEQPLSFQAGAVKITGTLDYVAVDESCASVADWKFYHRPDMLPEITRDLQMITYAAAVKDRYPHVRQVTVYRFLCYHNRPDTIVLPAELLDSALQVVTEEAETIWNCRHELRPGAQCSQCFQSYHCPAMQDQFRAIKSHEIQPYEGGEFMDRQQVLDFLLAVPIVERRIKEGMAAARQFVESLGEPIRDLTSQKEWGPKTRTQDTIVDPGGCLGELMNKTSVETGLMAAKTSKKAIEDALKSGQVKPKERAAFIGMLRDKNLIQKVETAPRWEWRAIKDE